MTTLREAFKAVLDEDTALMALLTGGVYDSDALGRTGLTPDSVQREADGVTMKPAAVIRWRGESQSALKADTISERRFVEVYVYADRGHAVLEQVKARAKALLHRRQLGPTDDGLGLNFVVWVDSRGEFVADELQGAAADRLRFVVDSTWTA